MAMSSAVDVREIGYTSASPLNRSECYVITQFLFPLEHEAQTRIPLIMKHFDARSGRMGESHYRNIVNYELFHDIPLLAAEGSRVTMQRLGLEGGELDEQLLDSLLLVTESAASEWNPHRKTVNSQDLKPLLIEQGVWIEATLPDQVAMTLRSQSDVDLQIGDVDSFWTPLRMFIAEQALEPDMPLEQDSPLAKEILSRQEVIRTMMGKKASGSLAKDLAPLTLEMLSEAARNTHIARPIEKRLYFAKELRERLNKAKQRNH